MKKKKIASKTKKKPVKPAKKKVSAVSKKLSEKKKPAATKKKKPLAAPKKKVLKPAKKTVAKPAKKKVQAVKPKVKPLGKKAAKLEKKAVVVPGKIAAPVEVKKVVNKKPATPKKVSQGIKKPVAEVKPDPVIPGWTKVQFEYFTRSSVGVLFNAFSTASGMAGWFADYVDSQENLFSFTWDGSEEKAYLVEALENEYARFRWFSQPEGAFFEFRIRIDGITNEVALVITDYVESGEENEARLLWDSIVHELMHVLGS